MPCLDVRCPCKPAKLQKLYGVEPSRPVCRECRRDRVDDDTETCWVCRMAAARAEALRRRRLGRRNTDYSEDWLPLLTREEAVAEGLTVSAEHHEAARLAVAGERIVPDERWVNEMAESLSHFAD